MGNLPKALGWGAAALAGAACFSVSATSYADAAETLRPSTRSAWYAAGIGPSIGVVGCGGGGCSNFGAISQFQFTNEIGWHFSGDGSGPAIGGIVLLGFSSYAFATAIRFSPQFKFWWDIPVVKKYAIYLTPGVSGGYGLFSGATGFGSSVAHFFSTQATFAGRLVIKDRGIVFFQPVTIDVAANGDGALISYNIIAGGGVTFP